MNELTETPLLLGRVIAALQAETRLQQLSVEGLHELFQTIPEGEGDDYLPETAEELGSALQSLHETGYIEFDNSNPHVSVSFKGLLLCGPLPIPPTLIPHLRANLSTELLR